MIKQLLQTGLESNDIIGYHGTSVETIVELAETGVLPVRIRHLGEIYFYPVDYEDAGWDAVKCAGRYADWNAEKVYMMRHLPFNIHPEEVLSEMDNIAHLIRKGKIDLSDPSTWRGNNSYSREYKQFFDNCRKHNISNRKFMELFETSSENQGVILTLSARVLEDFSTDTGIDGDKIIYCTDGLPVEYVTGIKPLGEYEINKLKELGLLNGEE